MAHYVMSDIHGEADRFYAMLAKIQFSADDTLYILGDVIDRGLDGIKLIQKIMDTSNMVLLLGNHEHMMIEYFSPGATGIEIRRWNKNGNAPTLASYLRVKAREQREIMNYLKSLSTHLEVEVNGERFYLVHGFPVANVHDEVWSRPEINTPNPISDCRLIIGHTPVLSLMKSEERRMEYAIELESRGEHLRICHAEGFIDVDCGCGHSYPIKALACIRLDDMVEFYV